MKMKTLNWEYGSLGLWMNEWMNFMIPLLKSRIISFKTSKIAEKFLNQRIVHAVHTSEEFVRSYIALIGGTLFKGVAIFNRRPSPEVFFGKQKKNADPWLTSHFSDPLLSVVKISEKKFAFAVSKIGLLALTIAIDRLKWNNQHFCCIYLYYVMSTIVYQWPQ